MKIQEQGRDEIASMVRSVNLLIEDYTKKTRFSAEIQEGNLDTELHDIPEDDRLGQSLIGLRDKLKQAKRESEEREKEEQKRRWTNEGIAQFADLLRRNHDRLEDLSYSIISSLVQYLDANQGGIFLLNDNDPQDTFFELKAAYAFDRKKHLEKQIKWGEGLVGNVALERKHVYMTQLPQDYINITSGLGGTNPDSLLIMPLQTDEEVVGVLEIASFKKLEQYHIDFVQKVAESIASTINSMKTNIKTNELLEKSQQQAEEMTSQEEEMRQNMEEMQATQEELSRKIKDNEEMHQALAREKALLDALMDNLPDYIYFKDRNSQFIRISKSMLPLFPVDTVEAMIGKSDFDFHQKEAAQGMYEEEQEIIRTEKGFEDKIQHEITETGKDQWVSVTKLPLYDQDGELMGTFGISKDITRFKQLETEALKKGKNQ
jgi:PAS domain S-box-containing protein